MKSLTRQRWPSGEAPRVSIYLQEWRLAIIAVAQALALAQRLDAPEGRGYRGRMSTRTASCFCGQLSIEVEGPPRGVGVCHCLACQQRTGSVFAALAGFRAPYRVSGTATEFVRTGDAGATFRFRFCPVCGSTVFHTEEGYEGQGVSVAVGAFADPSFPPPTDSVYDCRRHSWVTLPDGIAIHQTDPA